jgi:hypothetical protein
MFYKLYQNDNPNPLHKFFVMDRNDRLYCVCKTFEEADLVMESLSESEMSMLGLD